MPCSLTVFSSVRKEYIYDNREFWNTIDNHNEKILRSCSGYSTGVRIPLTPRDVVSLSNGTCDFVSSYFSIPEGVENLIGPYTDTALSSEERIFYGVYYGRCQIFVNSQLVYKADDWSFLKSKKIGVKPGDIVTVFIQIDDTMEICRSEISDFHECGAFLLLRESLRFITDAPVLPSFCIDDAEAHIAYSVFPIPR